MSYLETNAGRPDPRAISAVVVLHAAMGLVLVTGLTVSGVMEKPSPPIVGESVIVPLPAPPPPPPTDQQKPQVDPPVRSEIHVPTPPLPLPPLGPQVDSTQEIRDVEMTGVIPSTNPTGTATGPATLPLDPPTPTPTVTSTAAPTRATPRGNPGDWVTTGDYRSRWINEGMVGTARFRLAIGANGRVTDCTVTRTTGHGALDAATCDLIQRRARFTPSRDGTGAAVPGSYEGSIVWRLPE